MEPATAIGLAAAAQQLIFALTKTLMAIGKYCSEYKHAPEECKVLENKLSTSMILVAKAWVAIEGMEDDQRGSLGRLAGGFLKTIEQLRLRIQPHQSQGIKRLVWPLKKEATEEVINRIRDFENNFRFALELQIS
jgi:hypothetical protein